MTSPRPNQNGSAPGESHQGNPPGLESSLSPSRSARSSDQQAGGGETYIGVCPECRDERWIECNNSYGEPCPVCCKGDAE